MDGNGMWNADFMAQLAAMGAIPEEQALLMKQMGIGQEQAQTPMPTGQQVGRYYIAANPMEHAAAALQRYLGNRQSKQAQEGLQASFAKQTEGRNSYAAMLAEVLRQRQQQPDLAPVEAPSLIR